MKKQKVLHLFIILAFFFIVSAKISQAAGPTYINTSTINTPTVWSKANSPYIIQNSLTIKADLAIEPGTVIKISGASYIYIGKSLSIKGSDSEKIIFTSIRDDSVGGDTNNDASNTAPTKGDWGGIRISDSVNFDLENVQISYATTALFIQKYTSSSSYFPKDIIIRNCQIKYSGQGINIYKSKPTVENNEISNNDIGIYVVSDLKYGAPQVRNNSIINNIEGARALAYYNVTSESIYLDATNNWWGDKTGPYFKHLNYGVDNLDGKGNPVSDGILFGSWLQRDPSVIRKPVILIPGIGASINPDLMIGGILNDKWTMFDHTYDGIIQSFENMGYTEGKDFFVAYYDWRKSNAESAKNYLEPLIQKANFLNGTSKVNLVAHSMGGLVARNYIQSDDYANNVDNLIMIATPNKGSSDVYTAWEGGYIPKNWENRFMIEIYKDYLKIKDLTLSDYSAIHSNIPSIKELMPIYNYIIPKNTSQLKDYSAMSEINDFLQSLNNGLDILNQRVKVSIIAGSLQPTVSTIPTVDSDDSNPDLWKDGKPDPIDPERSDTGGDGRVLLSSAQIQSQFYDILNYSHGDIVSQAEPLIAQRLNDTLDKVYYSPQINDEMGFWFASPLDVEIKDPEGKIISSNNINQVPLAKYAGESKADGFKIISIPNPIKGIYEIKITGNGNGDYHIGSEYFDYTEKKQGHSSLTQGIIKEGEVKEYKVSYDPDNNENPISDIKPKDTTPPDIAISIPEENKTYLNNETLNINYSITDNVSTAENILKEIFLDGVAVSPLQIDLALEKLGGHKFKITAEDEAGNKSEKEIAFTVSADINSIIDNVGHYYDLRFIADDKTKDFLLVKLSEISHIFEMLAKMENKTPPYDNQAKLLNKKVDDLIGFVQDKKTLDISDQARELLIESLESLKY